MYVFNKISTSVFVCNLQTTNITRPDNKYGGLTQESAGPFFFFFVSCFLFSSLFSPFFFSKHTRHCLKLIANTAMMHGFVLPTELFNIGLGDRFSHVFLFNLLISLGSLLLPFQVERRWFISVGNRSQLSRFHVCKCKNDSLALNCSFKLQL